MNSVEKDLRSDRVGLSAHFTDWIHRTYNI